MGTLLVLGKGRVMEPETDGLPNAELLMQVYQRLYRRYGPQGWWPGDGPLDVVIGAILTQSAAWTNVEKALSNLKEAGVMSIEDIRDIPEERLADLLRPSGTFNSKARKVKAFINHLCERHGGGGHAKVAAISLPPAERAKAQRLGLEIAELLRRDFR